MVEMKESTTHVITNIPTTESTLAPEVITTEKMATTEVVKPCELWRKFIYL